MLDKAAIARRSQDIQAGLKEVTDSRVFTTLPITNQIGMAALLAVHIRGLDQIGNKEGLYHLAATLGIPAQGLPNVLRTLADAGWITVSPSLNNPEKIEERIPLLSNLYECLGDQWWSSKPGETEQKNLYLVDQLLTAPLIEEEAQKKTNLDYGQLELLTAIGDIGGYIRRYISPKDQIPILYSPLLLDEHPETLLNMVAQDKMVPGQISDLISKAKTLPGLPVDDLMLTNPLIPELVNNNILPAPRIDSSAGMRTFLYAPYITDEEKTTLEKARILLSGIRYGEWFSTVTRIEYPAEYMLQTLLDRKMIGKTPHQNIGTQYAGAASMGLGYIQQIGSRYSFYMYDTEDNIRAVKLAQKIAKGATEEEARIVANAWSVRPNLTTEMPTGFVSSSANRSYASSAVNKAKRLKEGKAAKELSQKALDSIRGIRRA